MATYKPVAVVERAWVYDLIGWMYYRFNAYPKCGKQEYNPLEACCCCQGKRSEPSPNADCKVVPRGDHCKTGVKLCYVHKNKNPNSPTLWHFYLVVDGESYGFWPEGNPTGVDILKEWPKGGRRGEVKSPDDHAGEGVCEEVIVPCCFVDREKFLERLRQSIAQDKQNRPRYVADYNCEHWAKEKLADATGFPEDDGSEDGSAILTNECTGDCAAHKAN